MIDKYLNLIPSANRQQPRFIDTLTANLASPLRVQELMRSLTARFDVDTAVGEQLDFIGEWVGVSRFIPIPIPGVYFSWDTTIEQGWEFGIWQDQQQPTEISTLPDDVYRQVIRGKIASNSWDGLTETAYEIWSTVFPNVDILIQDNQNMTYDLIFTNGIVDSLTLALLGEGYVPLKPEGVRLAGVFYPVEESELFGWDIENEFFAGWDSGSWAAEVL